MEPPFSQLAIYNDLLSPEECTNFIQRADPHLQRLGNRHRWMFDDEDFAHELWQRIKTTYPFPETVDEFGEAWDAVALNPRFRLSKYDPGDAFGRHVDGYYQPTYDYRSFATLSIYLNDQFRGGKTYFNDWGISVTPKRGRAFLFLVDEVMHEGQEVRDGYKYLLRTDVMYKPVYFYDHGMRQLHFRTKQEAEEYDELGVQTGTPDERKWKDLWTYTFHLEDLIRKRKTL